MVLVIFLPSIDKLLLKKDMALEAGLKTRFGT